MDLENHDNESVDALPSERPLVDYEQIACTDPRWQWWSAHVLGAIVSGVTLTQKLLEMRPGRVGPSKLRQCLAWLELNGMAIWSARYGWRPTDYGRKRLATRRSFALDNAAE